MRRAAVLSAFVLWLVAAPAHAIVGGSVSERDWPGAVQLWIRDGDDGEFEFSCGANLVHPQWALTAAHCAQEDAGRLKVVAGRRTLSGTGGEEILAKRVVVHPDFDGQRADVALLELERAASPRPIRVLGTDEADRWRPGTAATVVGWGAQVFQGPPSDELREVQVPIVSDDECGLSYALDFDPETMFCAGERTGRRDACSGDSGGPLMVPDAAGAFALAGVVSFGLGCAFPTQYGVYARIAGPKLRSWLAATLPAAPVAGGGPGAGEPGTAPPRARVRFGRDLGSARRARQRRRVVVPLRTTARVRDVRVTLRRLGSARLRSLTGSRRVRVRLSRAAARRVRAGRVRVVVTARDAQDRRVRASGTARLSR